MGAEGLNCALQGPPNPPPSPLPAPPPPNPFLQHDDRHRNAQGCVAPRQISVIEPPLECTELGVPPSLGLVVSVCVRQRGANYLAGSTKPLPGMENARALVAYETRSSEVPQGPSSCPTSGWRHGAPTAWIRQDFRVPKCQVFYLTFRSGGCRASDASGIFVYFWCKCSEVCCQYASFSRCKCTLGGDFSGIVSSSARTFVENHASPRVLFVSEIPFFSCYFSCSRRCRRPGVRWTVWLWLTIMYQAGVLVNGNRSPEPA